MRAEAFVLKREKRVAKRTKEEAEKSRAVATRDFHLVRSAVLYLFQFDASVNLYQRGLPFSELD